MNHLLTLAQEGGFSILWVLIAILGIIVLVAFIIILTYLKLWLKAVASHSPVGFSQFIGMFFRGIQAVTIVDFRIKAVNAGIPLGVGEMQNFYLATGRDRNCIPVVVSNLIRARQAGVDIEFKDLCKLYLQGGNVAEVTQALIQISQAGLDVPFDRLLQHHMAGGRVVNVSEALISANRAKIPIDFAGAAQIDLAGRDVVDAVQTTVKPKVIDCPDPNRGVPMLDAVAKDGVRLLAKARVTVRTNIERVIGGATQETIIARVGQGIVSAIGSTSTYKDVLENPDKISRRVLDNSLDSQTAYEIVSIDIADISVAGVGEKANVGAYLEAERAETDKLMRQAEAEGRRALAVAQEQENKAEVQKNRARVVLAQAEVPKAIAEAFRSGHLGVMDYYRLQNIQSDTGMRKAISGDASEQAPGAEE